MHCDNERNVSSEFCRLVAVTTFSISA